jgi:hypothetical protein
LVQNAFRKHGLRPDFFRDEDADYEAIYDKFEQFAHSKRQLVLVSNKNREYQCLRWLELQVNQITQYRFYELEDFYYVLNLYKRESNQPTQQHYSSDNSTAVSSSTKHSKTITMLPPLSFYQVTDNNMKKKCKTHSKMHADLLCPLHESRLLVNCVRSIVNDSGY